MIAIKLDQQIECGLLCNKIQKMINEYIKTNSPQDKILLIKIIEIIADSNEHVPKLTQEVVHNNGKETQAQTKATSSKFKIN